jgi:hypothetical protein
MVFYYVAAATLYSATTIGDTTPPRCPQGHEVSPFAGYWEICGGKLPVLHGSAEDSNFLLCFGGAAVDRRQIGV